MLRVLAASSSKKTADKHAGEKPTAQSFGIARIDLLIIRWSPSQRLQSIFCRIDRVPIGVWQCGLSIDIRLKSRSQLFFDGCGEALISTKCHKYDSVIAVRKFYQNVLRCTRVASQVDIVWMLYVNFLRHVGWKWNIVSDYYSHVTQETQSRWRNLMATVNIFI